MICARRDGVHSAAPPSAFSRCVNSDGEGASAKSGWGSVAAAGREGGVLSFYWRPLFIPVETPTKGTGRVPSNASLVRGCVRAEPCTPYWMAPSSLPAEAAINWLKDETTTLADRSFVEMAAVLLIEDPQ